MPRPLALALAVLASSPVLATAQDAAPPKPAAAAAEIRVDTSDTPDLADYGKKVQDLAEAWYPRIVKAFPSEGYTAPDRVTITFRKDYKGVAAASGNRIVCAEKWFTEHPEDLGAIIHELVHVVQRYRRGSHPGWLVEGIADHFRFFTYEPEDQRPRPRGDRARYDASYRVSAAFLEWARQAYDPELVVKLNAACREGKYAPEIWMGLTGKDLPTLGEAWKESLKAE